jgi:Asp-tRNA(Asn)/Glu-tRNA(Gln) amidotransferase A subunit family amidase
MTALPNTIDEAGALLRAGELSSGDLVVTGDGLPLSLQIVAPVGADGVALGVGDAYQRVTDWHLRIPSAVSA